MMNMLEVKEVKSCWVYHGFGYIYSTEPGKIEVDHARQSVRFTLKELRGIDWDLEALVWSEDGAYRLRTQMYWGGEAVPLKAFDSADELILHLADEQSQAYFHFRR